MAKKVTYVAEHNGQRFTRTATTGRVYTHVTIARSPRTNEEFDCRWSMSAANAAKKLSDGWEEYRVTVVPCYPEGQEPKVEEAPAAPAAEVELCASNSNAKTMHYRHPGQQVTLCLAATTSRKANARQIADNKICTGCAAAHQG